jgi:uridine phosphorylase
MTEAQWHILCKPGDVARHVLLPGDPGRVKRIAAQMDAARLVAENREYIVYTGTTRGVPVTVCSTGIGGPAASIALEELVNVGAQVFIRVGSCAGRLEDIPIGMPIVVKAAYRGEGTSNAYLPLGFPAVADLDVSVALIDAARASGEAFRVGIADTRDAFYMPDVNLAERMRQAGVIAGEQEAATLFVVGAWRGVRVGAIATTDSNKWLAVQLAADERRALFAQGEKKMIAIALHAVQLLAERGI